MKTTAQFGPTKKIAVFENNGVKCDNPDLLHEILMSLKIQEDCFAFSSPSIPDADYARAEIACKALEGEVIAHDKAPPDNAPRDRIY